MKKLILAILLSVSVSAVADNRIDGAWLDSIKKEQDRVVYYEDENGHIRKWQPAQKYETWTDIDENVYDYEIIIKVK